ncbi:chaplin [Allostreptomyces psammosilenae]|uniref:Chaplin domain-containing protein n=1 Tax=Allostreptomyces psammosilenae TaxID=1892865 RepID=A0A852ZNG6_9ACTN|nr:chaplin [Allostreptomyces psammosilenae]NYI03953.1 hypothetical protein [Allostreptomyces psammosilenae]
MKLIKMLAVAAAGTGLVLGGAGVASADAEAEGEAIGSPGIVSGNVIQAPIHIPANVCGNTIDIIGVLNPAGGNACVNAEEEEEEEF